VEAIKVMTDWLQNMDIIVRGKSFLGCRYQMSLDIGMISKGPWEKGAVLGCSCESLMDNISAHCKSIENSRISIK
jgi:hypothetical protein